MRMLLFGILLTAFSLVWAEKPNFVVILADDLSATEIGCYGNDEFKTPNIDKLAQRGTMFKTCYASPNCTVSRVMLMTGRYGFRTGWHDFILDPYAPTPDSPHYDIGKSEITFADLLKTQGYRTGLSGKWQLPGKPESLVSDCGFDEYCIWLWRHQMPEGKYTGLLEEKSTASRYWHPGIAVNGKYQTTKPDDYGPDLYNRYLIDFIRRNREQKFLAYYPMCLTHSPWEPTPDLYNPGKKTSGGLYHNIEYMDYLVGLLVQAIDEMGLREKTMIIFLSDGGTGHKEKGKIFARNVRAPLIVSQPKTIPEGVVSNELVSITDILPTLAELSGAKLPEDREIDGKSLVKTLHDNKHHHRDWVFSHRRTKRILRDQRWLLDGDGKFYDCGNHRDWGLYKDVSDSKDPEVLAAKQRFMEILKDLPAPPEIKKSNYLGAIIIGSLSVLAAAAIFYFLKLRK